MELDARLIGLRSVQLGASAGHPLRGSFGGVGFAIVLLLRYLSHVQRFGICGDPHGPLIELRRQPHENDRHVAYNRRFERHETSDLSTRGKHCDGGDAGVVEVDEPFLCAAVLHGTQQDERRQKAHREGGAGHRHRKRALAAICTPQ